MISYIYKDNLESERLVTRWLTLNDINAWADFFKDEESVKFLPVTELLSPGERSKFWIEKQLKRYADKKFGLQALIDKETGEFIGQCGLLMQEVDGKTEIEVGYHIFRKNWGQGYAPEAAKLFIDYAFKNNITNTIISIIHCQNLKSQRVAEKNGLIKLKQTAWSDLDVTIYGITKETVNKMI
ncbi:MAG: GNAT family N-acetyltransferase [Bacteroidia bacterium]